MKKNAWKIILAIAVLVCIVCLGRFDGSSIRTIRQSRQGKRHSKPLQELNLLGRMTGMNQRKFQQGLSMDRRLILRS